VRLAESDAMEIAIRNREERLCEGALLLGLGLLFTRIFSY
jgi:hypothetical protein